LDGHGAIDGIRVTAFVHPLNGSTAPSSRSERGAVG
jgi:hypothetical protein